MKKVASALLAVVVALGIMLSPLNPATPPAEAFGGKDTPAPASAYDQANLLINLNKPSADGDPFAEKDPARLIDVYGFNAKYFVYDTEFGTGWLAQMVAETSNNIFAWAQVFVGGSWLLMYATLHPSVWTQTLDGFVQPVANGVHKAVFSPWIGVGLVLVACLSLWAAARGNIPRVVGAGVWALAILVGSSALLNYPLQSVKLVDDTVSGASQMIAQGFSEKKSDSPDDALADSFDQIFRTTVYNRWLDAHFGDHESEIAKTYGARLYAATHLTLKESEIKRKDVEKYDEIKKQKNKDFEAVISDIKKADKDVYDSYIAGIHGRASSTFMAYATVMLTLPFVILAAFGSFVGLTMIRIAVPLLPAAAPLFVMDSFQDKAVEMGRKVGAMIIVAPLWWLAANVNIVADRAVFDSKMGFGWQLLVVTVIMFVLWKFFRPLSTVTSGLGLSGMGTKLGRAIRTAMQFKTMSNTEKTADNTTALADETQTAGRTATTTTRTPTPALPPAGEADDDAHTYAGSRFERAPTVSSRGHAEADDYVELQRVNDSPARPSTVRGLPGEVDADAPELPASMPAHTGGHSTMRALPGGIEADEDVPAETDGKRVIVVNGAGESEPGPAPVAHDDDAEAERLAKHVRSMPAKQWEPAFFSEEGQVLEENRTYTDTGREIVRFEPRPEEIEDVIDAEIIEDTHERTRDA